MSETIENIALNPSLLREQWLPLDVAVREVVAFEKRFGVNHFVLACHAALPWTLTPELLNLIHLNFLEQEPIPWISEVDLLLSPLCRQIDEDLYEVEPHVREVLLVELEQRFGQQRLRSIAEFLLTYLEKKPGRIHHEDRSLTQRWIALSYLHPDQVIMDLTKLLEKSLVLPKEETLNLQNQILVVHALEILAEPLEQTSLQEEYRRLVHSTRVLAYILYGDEKALKESVVRETSAVKSSSNIVTLFSPIMQQWLANISKKPVKVNTSSHDAPQKTVSNTRINKKSAEVKPSESQQPNIKQLLLRAHLQIEEGQHQLALLLLEGIRSTDPKEQKERDYLLGWCHTLNRSWKDAQNVLTKVVNIAEAEDEIEHEDTPDRERRGLAFMRLGMAAIQLAQYEDAIRHYNKCFKLLNHPKISRSREQVVCLYGIGTAYLMHGDFKAAINWYEEAKRLGETLEDEKELANIYYGLCQVYRRSGNLGEALHFGEMALYIYEKNAMHVLEGRMHNELGHIAKQLGNFRRASDHFTDSLALAINYNTPKMVMINNAALAQVCLVEERFEDARRFCQRALEVIESVDDAGICGWTYLTFGQVAHKEAKYREGMLRQQLLEEAADWFKKSAEAFSSTPAYADIAELYSHWGSVLEELGAFEEAIRIWKSGYEALSAANGPVQEV